MPTKKKSLLDHLIPPKEFEDDYVSRVINGIRDYDLLAYARETSRNVMLYGPTGPGKTSLILAYCARNKLPLVTLACNGALDPSTVFGNPVMDENGRVTFQESDVVKVVREGGVLYLDEINFMPPKIAAAFHGLLDKRRQLTLVDKGGELVVADPGLQIVAAYNPEYVGTRPLNPAFANRFPLKIRFDYDPKVEKKLVAAKTLVTLAQKLREAHKQGVIETPVSTNMLVEFEDFAMDLGYKFAVENFLAAFNDVERPAVASVIELMSLELTAEISEMMKEIEDEAE